METCRHYDNNDSEATFEERLANYLEGKKIDTSFAPQEPNRRPYVLYPHSDTHIELAGSTRVPDATALKTRK